MSQQPEPVKKKEKRELVDRTCPRCGLQATVSFGFLFCRCGAKYSPLELEAARAEAKQ